MGPLRLRKRGERKGPAQSAGEERWVVATPIDAWMKIERLAGTDPMTHLPASPPAARAERNMRPRVFFTRISERSVSCVHSVATSLGRKAERLS